MKETVLTQTMRVRNQDGGIIPPGRYIWRGRAGMPVFAIQDSRDIVSENIDVVCETPCEAVVVCERTRSTPGTIPSTNHGFTRWRIYGNTLADRAFWFRGIDANNEHALFTACSVYGCHVGWTFNGQQSKEHQITHCRFESGLVGVSADSSVQLSGGVFAVCRVGVELTRVGDPVVIIGTAFEACARLLVTSGPTTAPQPVTLIGVRYEADQLHDDGDCVVLRHAGPLVVQGCRLGGGRQRVPRIALLGIGAQAAEIRGNTFGAFGAHRVSPVRSPRPTDANVTWGTNAYQRDANDPRNTESRAAWPSRSYAP
jgi:hypothetical protein